MKLNLYTPLAVLMALFSLVACDASIDLGPFGAYIQGIIDSVKLSVDGTQKVESIVKQTAGGELKFERELDPLVLYLAFKDPSSGLPYHWDISPDASAEEQTLTARQFFEFHSVMLFESTNCAGTSKEILMNTIEVTVVECQTEECNSKVKLEGNTDGIARRTKITIPSKPILEALLSVSSGSAPLAKTVSLRPRFTLHPEVIGQDGFVFTGIESHTCINVNLSIE